MPEEKLSVPCAQPVLQNYKIFSHHFQRLGSHLNGVFQIAIFGTVNLKITHNQRACFILLGSISESLARGRYRMSPCSLETQSRTTAVFKS